MSRALAVPSGRIARVLMDSSLPQLDRLFDYLVPEALVDAAVPGVRVRVPFRSSARLANGYLVELVDPAGAQFSGKLSVLAEVVSPAVVLAPEVWQLARSIADRGAGSANDVLRLAVPPRQVRVEKAWLAGAAGARRADAAGANTAGGASEGPPGAIRGYPGSAIADAIAAGGRLALSAIPRVHELASGEWVGEWAITLAAAAVTAYHSGSSAILAVPDYRDQRQLAAALAIAAPAGSVAALDARQANADRYRAFLACLGDTPRIIIGNRSAVYAPARRLGLIAVWDDGDPLHAEPLAPYAHTRDIALVRAQQQGAALILAGHTRSVEAQRLVELGWLRECVPAPPVHLKVIPTAQQVATDAAAQAARIPSSAWREAKAGLEHGPVLVQVATPGYAPVLACQDCRQAARCPVCGGPLGLPDARSQPTCGWCGALATGWRCENCDGARLRLVSVGAGRTAEELGRAFPGVRVMVADGAKPVLSIGSAPVLVIATRGAEPIAAGGYRAILLLDGERMLSAETLHVGDDCLRWWSNAAALGAPDAKTMLVGVDGQLAQTLATWRHAAYASSELAQRRTLRFPPAVRTASVTGPSDAVEAAIATLDGADVLDVLGPVAAPAPGGMNLVRAIARFDYAHGAAVATTLRAAVIRNASSRTRSVKNAGAFRPSPTLRVRFDDPEIL